MVSINLLPWRRYVAAYQKKIILTFMLAAFLLSLLMAVITHFLVANHQAHLHMQIAQIKNSIAKLGDKEEIMQSAQATLSAKQTINALLNARSETYFLLEELDQSAQKNVCFSAINQQKNQIEFLGIARSLDDLTRFLKQWDPHQLFSEIKIISLNQTPNHLIQFRFNARKTIS